MATEAISIVVRSSQILGDLSEFVDGTPLFSWQRSHHVFKAVIQVVLNERFLRLLHSLFHRMKLLGDINARPSFLDHVDDAQQMPIGAPESLGDDRVIFMKAFMSMRLVHIDSYPPGMDNIPHGQKETIAIPARRPRLAISGKRRRTCMRNPYRQAISLFMLVTFLVMGSGAYGFSSKWVAHELDHATVLALADHSHDTPLDAHDDNPDAPQPLSDSEHRLLHALGYCESGPHSSFDKPRAIAARPVPLLPTLQVLLSADPEPSFRPPRSASLI